MLTFLRKRLSTRESGFTMIELLVAVVIIAILAAIAVPVYLNLKNEAQKSALKSDVNATVKAASIALTQGTPLDTITVNNGAAYVPADPAKGENIYIVAIDSTATTTGAAFVQDRDNSSDGYVIKSATFSGKADGVAKAATVAATADQYFYVYGVLDKTKGAAVNYTYSFSSVSGKYSQGAQDGTGVVNAAPTMPVLSNNTLTDATIGKTYSGSISATGTPTPTFSATGLPTGLTIDSASGAISGTPSGPAQAYTVAVKATNSIGTASQNYTLNLVSAAKVKINTTAIPSTYTGVTGYNSGAIDVTNTSTTGTNTFTITGLPTGFTYSPTTGTVTGSSSTPSNNTLSVKVANDDATDTANVYFTVLAGAAPAITSPSTNGVTATAGALGTPYSYTFTVTDTPTPTVSFTNLPAGLTYNSVTGKIEGTPTATANAVTVTATAKNAVNTTGVTRTFVLTITGQLIYSNTFPQGGSDSTWSGSYNSGYSNTGAGVDGYGMDGFGSYLTWTPKNLVVGKSYTFKFWSETISDVYIAGTDYPVTSNQYSGTVSSVTFTAASTSPSIQFYGQARGYVDNVYLYRNN